MINESSSNFNRGIIINSKGIQLSNLISYNLKPQHENNSIKNLSADDLEHVSQIFDADKNVNSTMALLSDETFTNDIFLMIQCTKVKLIIKKESIKPSDELINKIEEALKHNDSYHKLLDVFKRYGHFLPKKVTLGHKLFRMTFLTVDKIAEEPDNNNNGAIWSTLDDFPENKLEDIFNQWEECINSYNLDLSYLVSINGELIMKNKIKMWIKFCLESDLDSLQVISCKELYPLYEIFDLPLRQKVESVFAINRQIKTTLGIDNQDETINKNNIKERVLMAGIVPIKDPPYSYSVKFPVCFKSNNYQIFGKFITQYDEPIDEVIIKFDFMSTYGFLIFMDDYELTYVNPKIAWILIGIPVEIGYFSLNTRKIKVLGSGNEPFALKSNNNNIVLKVPENLPYESVIVVSFKHPPSNYEPNFIAKIQSYRDNKILFNIHCPDYESSDSEENNEDSKPSDNEEANKDKVPSDQEHILRNALTNNKDEKEYSNNNLDDIEFVHKNDFSNKEDSIIGEGSNSKYVDVSENINKSSHDKSSDNLANEKYEEYSELNDIKDSYFIKMVDFEYRNFNYNKRSPERNPNNVSEYSVQWFILQNSVITESSEIMIYLNKIGHEFHLKTKSKEKIIDQQIEQTSQNILLTKTLLADYHERLIIEKLARISGMFHNYRDLECAQAPNALINSIGNMSAIKF
ncbi:16456_t:CDS:2 [Dentiscutata erythropus]|uniref:16456_t:CDS:1 n=1 Tax=Dentiscutata erythropus TaxID=1348616 RepID=A0A9N8YNW0_9GLOM|nr:16456_t:CDS:2 [Dentiscutata erythropus]